MEDAEFDLTKKIEKEKRRDAVCRQLGQKRVFESGGGWGRRGGGRRRR
jgi:hypothetical protein